jgi:hypothetical protein
MTRRQVVANSLTYDFLPDDQPLLAERDWAIAVTQLVDDGAGVPLSARSRVRVILPGVQTELAQDGTRVLRRERGIAVKLGPDGTFALVTRPWVRFPPLGGPASTTVRIEADDFEPLTVTFPITYDQRAIVSPAAPGDPAVTLNSTADLATGQTLLFGPPVRPQYVRVRAIGAAGQVTLATGLLNPQGIGAPVFPDTFATPPAVIAALRRRPVTILGRVVTRNTAANVTTPVVNASVTVTDFWRTRAAITANPSNGAMTDPVLALRQFAVAVTPGVLASQGAGAMVGAVLLPSAADDRHTTGPADADDTAIGVDRRQNLASSPAPLPNRLVLIDADDPARAEYHTIAIVTAAGSAAEPARLTLEAPLARAHPEGCRVARLNPGVLPPGGLTLVSAAERGDRCLFLDAPIGSPVPGTLRITGGAVDEFQAFAPLSVQSDSDGYFRLPPLHRMARIALTVDDGAGNVLPPIEVDPDYAVAEQRVDAVYLV